MNFIFYLLLTLLVRPCSTNKNGLGQFQGLCLVAFVYVISCQGVVQLGGPAPRFVRGGPAKVGACKSILFTDSSCVVKIKNTWLVLQSRFIFYHFAAMLYAVVKCHNQLLTGRCFITHCTLLTMTHIVYMNIDKFLYHSHYSYYVICKLLDQIRPWPCLIDQILDLNQPRQHKTNIRQTRYSYSSSFLQIC